MLRRHRSVADLLRCKMLLYGEVAGLLRTSICKESSMSSSMGPWLHLFIAGLLEIGWAVGLKYSDGFSRLMPSVLTVLAMIASFWFLALAMRHIPLGTAYAIWTGIGAIGTVILGMVLFGESRDILRVLCILLIVSGIVGLKLVGGAPAGE